MADQPKAFTKQASQERERAASEGQDSEQLIKRCAEIEDEIAVLRAKYEQYFLGVERRPPTELHTKVKRLVNELKTASTRATAAKFKIQALGNKFLTYERLWTRTQTEMENGTYHRDVFKAKLRDAKRHGKPAETKKAAPKPDALDDLDITEDVSDEPAASPSTPLWQVPPTGAATGQHRATPLGDAELPPSKTQPGLPSVAALGGSQSAPTQVALSFKGGPQPLGAGGTPGTGTNPAVKASTASTGVTGQFKTIATVNAAGSTGKFPAVAPVGKAPGPGAARPAGGAPVGDDKMRAVYDAYVMAKKRCNEDTSKLSYDQVSAALKKQVPEIMKQHNAKSVEFKVVIKDGKAILRALPKD